MNARAEPEYPFIPGVLPADTDEWRTHAMAEAHELLPQIPGTQVHVLILDRVKGVRWITETFGAVAGVMIAAELARHGPDAVPTLCCRVPHDWAATPPSSQRCSRT